MAFRSAEKYVCGGHSQAASDMYTVIPLTGHRTWSSSSSHLQAPLFFPNLNFFSRHCRRCMTV